MKKNLVGSSTINVRLVGEILVIFGLLGVFLNVVGFFTERMSPSLFLLLVSFCAVFAGLYVLFVVVKKE